MSTITVQQTFWNFMMLMMMTIFRNPFTPNMEKQPTGNKGAFHMTVEEYEMGSSYSIDIRAAQSSRDLKREIPRTSGFDSSFVGWWW
jgi:hypothetical protein